MENSIEHGLLPNLEGGKLYLRCTREKDRDIITVEDSGIGIPPEQLEYIRSTLLSSESVQSQHVGLQNCYRRFLFLFGDKFQFSIQSAVNQGTKITITIFHTT